MTKTNNILTVAGILGTAVLLLPLAFVPVIGLPLWILTVAKAAR